MKKIIGLLAVSLTLMGCGQSHSTSSTPVTQEVSTTAITQQQVTVTITQDGEAIEGSPFTLTFQDGDNLLNVMKEQLQIVEKDGFISSINGIEQKPDQNKYWLFDVNDQMSSVGANQVILKQGDTIHWKLEAFK